MTEIHHGDLANAVAIYWEAYKRQQARTGRRVGACAAGVAAVLAHARSRKVVDDPTDTAIQRAAAELPEGWLIEIGVEHHAGWVDLINPNGDKVEYRRSDNGIRSDILDALECALSAQRGEVANG